MSIAPPPKRPSNVPASGGGRIGSDQLIESRIAEACKALWQAEVIRTVLRLAVGSILVLLVWVVIDQWIYSPGPIVRSIAFLSLAALLAVYFARHVRPLFGSWVRPEYAARSLERDLPELRQALTSYVTLRGDRESGNLRSRVVRSIGAATAGRLRRHDALPAEATGTMRWWIAAIAGLAILVAYAFLSPKNSLQSAARLAAPLANIEPPRRVAIRKVQPGNSEAIAGRAVEISAEIEGLRSQERAICRWQLPSGWQELELAFDPADRRHSGQLQLPHSASGAVSYSIEAGDATAGPFQLTVQDVPVVALESVHYRPPQYTGLAPYTSSTGAITAVDGTTVEILASTNRAVSKAKIEFNPRPLGGRVQATAGATEMQIDASGTSLSVAFPLRSAQGRSAAVELEDYRILVEDASGQGNPDPIVYPIRVVPDLAPEISITVPASSPKSVPLDAQQTIEVHASDPDFGLKQISLEIRAGIDRIREPVLWISQVGEKGHQVAEFGLRPLELQLRAGDTVQVVAVAVDNRSSELYPDVESNVVRTDPVTLEITASGDVPDRDDPNADGLSSPDPNQDGSNGQSESQQGDGDSGQQGAGGGGSGQGSQSESGGGQGGSEGQGGTSETTQDSSNDSGGGGNEGQSTDPGQQGGQDAGAQGSQQDADTGDSGTGNSGDGNAGANDDSADAPNGEEPSESASAPERDDNNASASEQPAEGSGSQSQTGEAGESAGGQDSSNQQDQAGSNPPGAREGEANRQQGNTGTNNGSSQGSQSGSPSGNGGQQAGQPRQAPEHDGEAFERIQEFLEKHQNPQRDSQTSSGSQGASERTEGDRADDGQRNTQSGEGESRDPTEQGTAGAQQEQGNGSGETSSQKDGSSTGEGSRQSSGPDGSSPQTPADQQSPDGDSGQQASDAGGEAKGSAQDTASSDDQTSTGNDRGQSPNADAQPPQGGSASDSANGDQRGNEDQAADGDQAERAPTAGDREESNGSSGEPGSAQSGDDSQSPGSDSESPGQPGRSGSTQAGSPQGDRDGASNTTAQASSGGAGDGGELGEASQEPAPPPDPVNLDYAKEATDLVLDYLDQTRDNPDPELLEELKWSREDLKRFADRWKQIRELPGQPGGSGRQEMEEALKSLGLRPKTGQAKTTREAGDALRGIRDAGNRQPPPAAFRDAFDAFRRAVGQQQASEQQQ